MVLGLNRPINTAGRACKTRKFNRTARIVLDIKCMKSPATEQPDAVDEGRSIGAPDGGAHHQRKSQSSNSLSPLTPATLDGDRLQTLPNPNKYVDFSCPPAQPNLQCLRWPLCEPFDTDGGQLLSRGRQREREDQMWGPARSCDLRRERTRVAKARSLNQSSQEEGWGGVSFRF